MSDKNLSHLPTNKQDAIKTESEFYFTGKSCKHGHFSERKTNSSKCVQCSIEYDIVWRKENWDKKYQINKKYFQENPELMRAHKNKWKKNNKLKVRIDTLNRIARFKNAEGKYLKSDIFNKMNNQNYKCNGCECDISNSYHIDHIIPLSRGGSNWPSNIQLLCPLCNTRKSNKTMEEWRK